MDSLNERSWEIESLRLTSFLQSDFSGQYLEEWLRRISKNEPISIIKNINYFQGLAQIDTAMLKLEWNTNRIDLILNSNAPMIEKKIGLSSDIKKIMEDTLFDFFNIKDCPISKRLAIGLVLNIPIQNYNEGADILQPKLNSVSNLRDTTDFLFRINRPLQSQTQSEIKLNRLITWSIGYLQVINIAINVGQPLIQHQNIVPPQMTEMICRLEMDFNTEDQNNVILNVEQQKVIASELLDAALVVAEKGEHEI